MSSDTLQTVLGLAKAVIIGIADYSIHAVAVPDFAWTSPTFLMGILYAGIEGIKGYYAAGVRPAV